MLVLGFSAATSALAQDPVQPADATAAAAAVIRVELNRLETVGDACQPYLVFENRADYALTDLQLDLVLFDADGIVAERLAIDAAPLAAGKTSLVVFQVPTLTCDRIGRMLLNSVIACAGGPLAAGQCLDLVQTELRLDVPFFK